MGDKGDQAREELDEKLNLAAAWLAARWEYIELIHSRPYVKNQLNNAALIRKAVKTLQQTEEDALAAGIIKKQPRRRGKKESG